MIAVHATRHAPAQVPSSDEWDRFLAGCPVRPDDWCLFVTLGRLTGAQHLQAGTAGIIVIEGADEIARLAALHDLPPFDVPATVH